MRQIALYGKGGIGKSTVASHLSCTFAERGLKVLQVGCSPKNDSTYLLLPDFPPTILDVLRNNDFMYDELEPKDIIAESPLQFPGGGKIYCAESGGPEPGVGCGGKGVVEAIDTIKKLSIFKALSIDVVIYDILGQQVAVLTDGAHARGTHRFPFDASGLASGLYFIRATVPGQMDQVQKVMLVR